jgi:tetratricopeptide (TPR) repeat protein
MLPTFSLVGLLVAAAPAFTASQERLDLLEAAEKELIAAPTDVPTIVKTALVRKMAGRYEESLDLLMSCKAIKCGMRLAIAVSMTDDAPIMLSFFEMLTRAPQRAEDKAAAFRLYSQALVRAGRPEDAVIAARKAIAEVDAPMMHLDLAVALFAASKLTEAEKELDGALVAMPKQEATLYWKYRCLKQRSDKQATTVARAAFDSLVASVSDKLQDRGDFHGPHGLPVGDGSGGASVIPPQQRKIIAMRA